MLQNEELLQISNLKSGMTKRIQATTVFYNLSVCCPIHTNLDVADYSDATLFKMDILINICATIKVTAFDF